MQLTNTPGKLVLPFANAGAKNTIPTASQIGITAGAASLTDGFPPLTRTPIAAGGVPPSGLDMNGILYELSAILRWANAGGGYAYDAAFATNPNVGGYPKGARIMRSDGLGYWFNTVENNTTDPEDAGAAAAGWVPDFTYGVTSVAMASANVTLTPLQYGKPVIIITGTLTANLNLIFPTIVNEWTVINNTTGPYTITCKTAAGTGLVVNTVARIVGDGTNIQSAEPAVPAASETVAGKVELATAAETTAGTDNTRAVTPAGLAAAGATKLRTPRTITVGNTGKNFDGSINVSWSLAEIGVTAATETASGIIKIATAAEAQALASAVAALTPARLADAFKGANQSLAASGYQKLPGGLIIQWGTAPPSTGTTVSFPIAFPNAVLQAVATSTASASNSMAVVTALTTSQITLYNNNNGGMVRWVAFGY